MRVRVFSLDCDKLLRSEECEPECGKDFCDNCGDCLHCYIGDPCPYGEHSWVKYEDQEPDRAPAQDERGESDA